MDHIPAPQLGEGEVHCNSCKALKLPNVLPLICKAGEPLLINIHGGMSPPVSLRVEDDRAEATRGIGRAGICYIRPYQHRTAAAVAEDYPLRWQVWEEG